MGYRDDFYKAENIVGYSGSILDSPTVYFQEDTGVTIRFGRITQSHDHKLNVDRNAVREKNDYRIFNGPYKGETRCIEFYDGAQKHVSRSLFHDTAALSSLQMMLLKRSLINFPEHKGKLTASKKEKRKDRANELSSAKRVIRKNVDFGNLLAEHEDAIENAKPM